MNEETGQPVPLVGDREVVLDGVSTSWGKATAARTPIRLTLTVDNRLNVRISIGEVENAIRPHGVDVGGAGIDRELTLGADGTTTVRLTVAIVNARMNEWWVTHLRNGEVTAVRIERSGTATVPGVDQRYPFSVPDQNTTIETDSLGEAG